MPEGVHIRGMQRKTANIHFRVEPELVERIDVWRARQRLPPSRSSAIVHMLEQFLDDDPLARDTGWQRLLRRA
jgi:hypothetical protein